MSITVPLNGFGGGGGTSLNFDIKAYPTEESLMASTPKANTIGIITENKITSWVFDFTEPSAPAEGMVWITVGTSSKVAFNVLKKNAVQVYPISAKQYVGGAWMNVTTMSYQDGAWTEWIPYLFNAGDECTNITGGWESGHVSYNDGSSNNPSTGTATISDVMTLEGKAVSGTSGTTGSLTTKVPVDLSKYKTLYASGKRTTTANGNGPSVGIHSTQDANSYNGILASGTFTSLTEETIAIPIDSFSGLYYVSAYAARVRAGEVAKIWLE